MKKTGTEPSDLTRPSHELRGFTTSQLIEELARRQNDDQRTEPEHWCEDCRNFVAWDARADAANKDMPLDYNPCTKKHTMRFRMPKEIGDAYGFFMRVCADRASNTDPPSGEE
jgi:hypothetical protein